MSNLEDFENTFQKKLFSQKLLSIPWNVLRGKVKRINIRIVWVWLWDEKYNFFQYITSTPEK